MFEKLGLVWNVKHPKPEQIEAKRAGAASPVVRERQLA